MMRVKLNGTLFIGKPDKEGNLIIPLYNESDKIFFRELENTQVYYEEVLYFGFGQVTARMCFSKLSKNEDFAELYADESYNEKINYINNSHLYSPMPKDKDNIETHRVAFIKDNMLYDTDKSHLIFTKNREINHPEIPWTFQKEFLYRTKNDRYFSFELNYIDSELKETENLVILTLEDAVRWCQDRNFDAIEISQKLNLPTA